MAVSLANAPPSGSGEMDRTVCGSMIHFEGAVIEPLPTDREARDEVAIFVSLDEVFKDVKGNPRPVIGMFIHNPKFPARS